MSKWQKTWKDKPTDGYTKEWSSGESERGSKHWTVQPWKNACEEEKKETYTNMMESILGKENMKKAYEKVKRNWGGAGIDWMKVEDMKEHLKENWIKTKQELREENYKPQAVKRVEIPKGNGKTRLLWVPTVIDRMIQQAIYQVMSPIYENKFSENSYGFRPRRNAHQAIKKAKEFIESGYEYVVDMDLEKFFDKVNHDILMSRVWRTVKDKRLLRLIRKYLNSCVLVDGVIVKTEIGTPQGWPLSPLLANIILDDLDKELERRGLKFCRYADDCNIYVKSRRAGERVMASITNFIENKLKLKVNKEKSKIRKYDEWKFLGFSFYKDKDGKGGILVSDNAREQMRRKLKKLTRKCKYCCIEETISKINLFMKGWIAYFKIADMKWMIDKLLSRVRRRIRALEWHSRKRVRTRYKKLRNLNMNHRDSLWYANSRKGAWAISKAPTIQWAMANKVISNWWLFSFTDYYLNLRNS